MKKLLGLALALAIVVAAPQIARSINGSFLPPGIDAGNWVPMGDSAGFVVTRSDSSMGSAAPVGVVKGYFMVRRAGTWFRVDSVPDPGAHPAIQ
jgi:hypothetical protein